MKNPFSRFVIEQRSMLPTYKPGDRVLTFNLLPPTIGDVVVFRVNDKFYIKRIGKKIGDVVYVNGDNKEESSDFDPVRISDLIGKVIAKY